MSSCWKCPKCGHTVCHSDECTVCHGQGIKRMVKEDKLKKTLEDIGKGTYPSDADHKNFIREDI